jgi:hypothetical protein
MHQYAGAVLGRIPGNNDTVYIHEHERDLLTNELERFCEADSIEACKYCALPFDAPMVTAGIQLD